MQRYSIPAIKRAFEIVEFLATKETGSTLTQIQRELGLPLSSTATIIYTLRDLGYLEKDDKTSCYCLSWKLLGIASRTIDRLDLLKQSHDILEEAVHESGLTGHIAVLRGDESVYVDRVQSDSLVQFSSFVGLRWPAHASAVGKALLAFLPERELRPLVRRMKLKKLTRCSITSREVLLKQFRLFRKLGYTWEKNEGELGVGCVGAPIFGSGNQVVAALSLTGTMHQIDEQGIPRLGAIVKKYSLRMSARLGCPP